MSSLKLAVVMLIGVSLEMGLTSILKAAMSRGMNNFVFIVYSNLFALPSLLLLCFLFHRRRPPPPPTPTILWRIFLLGLISCAIQIFVFTGVKLSSPTLDSAMSDLVPAFTFILAIITRMESLDLRVSSSIAKLIGAIVSIGGALTMTMYEGPPIASISSTTTKLKGNSLSPPSRWAVGGSFSAIGAFMLAVLYVFQTTVIRSYPAELIVTFICCGFVGIQSFVVAVIAERNPSAWRLRPDLELIAILYSAVILGSLQNVAVIWVIRQKGPFFVAMFRPVGIVIAAIMGVTFLGNTLYLGSVIGAVIIAIGFYTVMWGMAKEEKKLQEIAAHSMDFSSQTVPLLENMLTKA